MIKYKIWLLNLFFLLCSFSFIKSELIVVKKIKNSDGKEIFAPLDLEDKADNAAAPIISKVILKYAWPMCIALDLIEQEKKELVIAGKENAEEIFIQKKIREELKGQGNHYYVVFVPTCVYELFCISLLFDDKKKENPLDKAYRILAYRERININAEINQEDRAKNIIKNVLKKYTDANDVFFAQDVQKNAWLYVNNQLADFLLKEYSKIETVSDGLLASKVLEDNVNQLASKTVDHVLTLYNDSNRGFSESLKSFIKNLKKSTAKPIVIRVASIEYEARKLNKALLLRGSSFIPAQTVMTKKAEGQEALIAGTTVQSEPEKLLSEYAEKALKPYSISFGNSLFAAVARMYNDCVFNYLVGIIGGQKNILSKAVGYAVLIDKAAYIEHQNNNLFFIPPLAPIAALFESGEFFHPRVKAATAKRRQTQEITGIISDSIWDPAGVILITRDPFKHAELFSKFLAENGRIIQLGDVSMLTEEEKKFAEEAMKNQVAAAKFYNDVRTVVPVIRKATLKRREKIDQQKAAASTLSSQAKSKK